MGICNDSLLQLVKNLYRKKCLSSYRFTRFNSPCFTLITRRITLGNLVWLATGCKVLWGICLADGVVASDASLISKNVERSLEVTLPNSLRIEN